MYLGSTVGMMIIMASLGLVGILSIFTFLEQVEDIRHNYTTAKVLFYVLQSVPRVFYETLPYAALIGCLAGLGILANNSELVVMRDMDEESEPWDNTLGGFLPLPAGKPIARFG